jgi:group I intron endonuclease
MEGHVYKITNNVNGKFYVGKTVKTVQNRFCNHCYDAIKRNSTTYLHRAIRKYGKENFIVEKIELCNNENLNEREIFWISTLKPHYNQTIGGEGICGYKHSKEYCKKMSERMIGKYTGEENPFYGQHHSEETKQRLSEFRTGKTFSEGFTGKSHKEESKSKTSQTLKNNPNIKRTKVFQYDIEGNFLREFQSITGAAQFVNTSPSNIKYTCEGKFTHCKGYRWSYQKLNT